VRGSFSKTRSAAGKTIEQSRPFAALFGRQFVSRKAQHKSAAFFREITNNPHPKQD
jgi:hypothetical protein